MSAESDQKACEDIELAILALQTDLAALVADGGLVHYDTATQTSGTAKNRISVKANPRRDRLTAFREITPFLYAVKLEVEIYVSDNDPALMDSYVAAVQSANTGVAPSGIVSLATTLFGARGFDIFNVEDASREDSKNERMVTLTYDCLFGA